MSTESKSTFMSTTKGKHMSDDPRKEIKQLLQSGRLKGLLIQAAQLHGHYCPGLAFGVKAGYAGLRRLGFDNTGMEELIAVVECNSCFVDGIQFTTGCSFGNNALIYKDLGKTAVTIISRKTSSAVRLVLNSHARESKHETDKEKEAADLFRRVVKERQDDPTAAARMKELFRESSFETVEKPEDELFEIKEVPPELPDYAPIVDSAVCSVCGETYMETKGSAADNNAVCLKCANADCMAVMGQGICVLKEAAFH